MNYISNGCIIPDHTRFTRQQSPEFDIFKIIGLGLPLNWHGPRMFRNDTRLREFLRSRSAYDILKKPTFSLYELLDFLNDVIYHGKFYDESNVEFVYFTFSFTRIHFWHVSELVREIIEEHVMTITSDGLCASFFTHMPKKEKKILDANETEFGRQLIETNLTYELSLDLQLALLQANCIDNHFDGFIRGHRLVHLLDTLVEFHVRDEHCHRGSFYQFYQNTSISHISQQRVLDWTTDWLIHFSHHIHAV